jgi:hypothetical protein
VWIDQELFMELSFPDVLVSSVLEVMDGARRSYVASTRGRRGRLPTRLWDAITRRHRTSAQLIPALDRAVENLRAIKHMPNDRQVTWTRTRNTGDHLDALGIVSVGGAEARVGQGTERSESVTSAETVQSSKEEYLERSLGDFRSLIVMAREGS